MRSTRVRVLVACAVVLAIGIYAKAGLFAEKIPPKANTSAQSNQSAGTAITKGIEWLVSVQGKDGGWGQDGGETSYVRQGERLESSGNDVANTAVAAEALLRAGTTPTSGPYRQSLLRAVNFILQHVEKSPGDGLAVTDVTATQIQRKLGPYIDTFLTSKLLAELDGHMGDTQANARVRRGLEKCIAKIEKNQLKDGSWNISGGWAPILGTSLASQSLYMARAKDVPVTPQVMDRIETYTKLAASAEPAAGVAGGVGSGAYAETVAVSAGVPLYKRAQEFEQLTRTEESRKKNAKEIGKIQAELADSRVMAGFGSIGGEEFFSYLNVGDSMHRAGGPEWQKWNADMTSKVLRMQNADGTWAGHHCITGRVAVTSAAILLLSMDREPLVAPTSQKRN